MKWNAVHAESNISVCFLSGKRISAFWCIASPLHRNTVFFLSGGFLPNFPGNNSNIRKLVWSVTCWYFIWRNQSKSTGKMGQMRLLKSKVVWEWFWNIYHVNEMYQSITQRHRRTNQIFFFFCSVSKSNTQGKLLLFARLVLFFNALMWKIQQVGKYKLENSFWSTAWQTKNPPIVWVQHWIEAFILGMSLCLHFTLFHTYGD